ncbi:MAG: CopG family transcriptional regulator, partial [Thermosphaera sp.]|nr:CopG family transcriptional regulator [Thermosphaera sp.]
YSFRIPRRLKEEMDKLRDVVDWRKEIVAFIEERVRMYKRQKALREVVEILKGLPETPKGTAVRLVREDRDSY